MQKLASLETDMAPKPAKAPAKGEKPATESDDTKAPPKGLGASGKAFWNQLHAELPEGFRFDGRELFHLEAACQLWDTLDALRQAIEKQGVSVKGSQGQDTVNPALSEARLTRLAMAQHLNRIELPDEDGVPESPRSKQARRAAQVRWTRKDNWSREAALARRSNRGKA